MKADILAFGAHPDDVELSCAGTLIKAAREGKITAIADLTTGELGTRGTPTLRLQEAEAAAQIMGVHARVNLHFKDGFFQNDEHHQREVVKIIRHFKPQIVLCNAIRDRHPDHGRAAELVRVACFLAGLQKIETEFGGDKQAPYRPVSVYNYIQDQDIPPHFLVDISDVMDSKMEAIKAYSSQFYKQGTDEPETYISTKGFMDRLSARNMIFGKYINAQYAEGYTCDRPIGTNSIFNII